MLIRELIAALETIASTFGDVPIKIDSGGIIEEIESVQGPNEDELADAAVIVTS